MCGIIGCVLKDDEAVPVLLECLGKLEYRGYDSVGIATSANGIKVIKDQSKIHQFAKNPDLNELSGKSGIAHVRWATHGTPIKENAHPHTDCNNRIAVVHNGIIENFKELRVELQNSGHTFTSNTDTEVIPHLIEKYLDEGQNLEEAIYSTTQKLKGSYALAIMFVDEPNKIIGIRKESPLIVGKGNGENFLTSDVSAILSHTDQVIYLDNMEMAILDGNGVTIKNLDGDSITKEIHTIEWSAEMAEKQGFDHFMLKEIHEQPNAVKQTLMEADEINNIIKKFPKFNKISFVACGTSYHASLVGKYLFETLTGVPTDVILASEFEYSASTLNENTLVILISQSGETADTLKALRIANKKSHTLVIVNVVGSTATREADDVIITRAGPEIGVAATKTYVSQLTVIYLMAILMGGNDDLLKTLENMPDYMEEALKTEDQIKEIAGKYSKKTDFFFIGRGYSYPTAIEGALKLKEITYIHAEGYAAGELKHGPLALIDDDVPVVAVIPPGISRDKTLSNMEEVKARNAHVIALGSSADETLKSESDEFIGLPNEINEMFSPLPYVIPMQLLSYYISVERGLDPDKPKNLAKCVTVE